MVSSTTISASEALPSCSLRHAPHGQLLLALSWCHLVAAGSFVTCLSAVLQLSPAYRSTQPGLFNLLFGAFGMPMGLALCLINGASLFTSNVAYMTAATLEHKASCLGAVRLLLLSYFTNIAGDLPVPVACCEHLKQTLA
jgi:formate/nitrite transporter FocA (FNT family)